MKLESIDILKAKTIATFRKIGDNKALLTKGKKILHW